MGIGENGAAGATTDTTANGASGAAGEKSLEFELRPQVPMSFFEGVPFVAALGVVDALREAGVEGVRIDWPHDVVNDQGLLAEVRVKAGYEGGMFAHCEVAIEDGSAIAPAVEAAVRARVASWEDAVAAGRAAAGPLAPVLDEYFDLMGPEDQALGLDVWGRR